MGPDGLSPRMLWETREYIAKALAKIFNASLQQGRIPLDWKEAKCCTSLQEGKKRHARELSPSELNICYL